MIIKDGILIRVESSDIDNGNLSLPLSVQQISGMAFYNLPNLRTVVVPRSVKKIYSNAFHSCQNLTTVKIKSKECKIYSTVFNRCESLETVYFPRIIE